MRTYKFRYFDKEDKRIRGFGSTPMPIGDLAHPDEEDHFVVMQWTGLKDKNDVEIYEDDIVEIEGPANKTYTRVIKFEQGTFHFGYVRDGMCDYRDMKVIGNIHQNPELLNTTEYKEQVFIKAMHEAGEVLGADPAYFGDEGTEEVERQLKKMGYNLEELREAAE